MLLEEALTPAASLWLHVSVPSMPPGTGAPVMGCTLDSACVQPSLSFAYTAGLCWRMLQMQVKI